MYESEGDTTVRKYPETKGYLRGREGGVSYPNEKEEEERRGREEREKEKRTENDPVTERRFERNDLVAVGISRIK